MRYSLLTLGCKVNRSEIDSIGSDITADGNEIVPLAGSPDVCIVNTCTVTAKSDYQSRQLIRRAVRSGARVIATGCYAELHGKEIRSKISEDIEIVSNINKVHDIKKLTHINTSSTLYNNSGRSRAFIKIQDGCDLNCTYCAIPQARGPSRSRSNSDILDEVKRAHDSGYNEVVITGIHIGLYYIDNKGNYDLKRLISDILGSTRIPRVRLSSLEIGEVDSDLLELVSDDRVCKHLHLPLQSGDDTILKRMGRSYNTSDFKDKFDEVVSLFPGISVGTDIIVGFPGEDDQSFARTRDFIGSLDLSYLHVFPYSKRNNTVASGLSGHVAGNVINNRASELRAHSSHISKNYRKMFVGRELDVIIEKCLDNGLYASTSGNYLKINVLSDNLEPGSLINIRVTGENDQGLIGIPLDTANV